MLNSMSMAKRIHNVIKAASTNRLNKRREKLRRCISHLRDLEYRKKTISPVR